MYLVRKWITPIADRAYSRLQFIKGLCVCVLRDEGIEVQFVPDQPPSHMGRTRGCNPKWGKRPRNYSWSQNPSPSINRMNPCEIFKIVKGVPWNAYGGPFFFLSSAATLQHFHPHQVCPLTACRVSSPLLNLCTVNPLLHKPLCKSKRPMQTEGSSAPHVWGKSGLRCGTLVNVFF